MVEEGKEQMRTVRIALAVIVFMLGATLALATEVTENRIDCGTDSTVIVTFYIEVTDDTVVHYTDVMDDVCEGTYVGPAVDADTVNLSDPVAEYVPVADPVERDLFRNGKWQWK